MLTTILHNVIPPKCIIIQDSLGKQGLDVLLSIVKNHVKLNAQQIHIFCFENHPTRILKSISSNNVTFYDYTSKRSWLDSKKQGEFLEFLKEKPVSGIIIIDSLAQVIIEYGIGDTYRSLHKLVNADNILQVATILHEDVLETNSKALEYFDFLSTLRIKLIPMINKKPRVDYIYRKSGGKIIKELEEYYFSQGDFYTKIIERPDAKVLLANSTKEILPEEVASFKIGLSENDKKLRDNFTLPYLKTSDEPVNVNTGGSIIYNLDENDDWDEEDPDDDLDI